MDANTGNDHDADLPAAWGTLARGPEMETRNPGSPVRSGAAGSVPFGGSVVFTWIDGQSSRRLHFAGDPLVVLPELDHTDAF